MVSSGYVDLYSRQMRILLKETVTFSQSPHSPHQRFFELQDSQLASYFAIMSQVLHVFVSFFRPPMYGR